MMTLSQKKLELRFGDCAYGLSARRLWEHTELGQINVFGAPIRARRGGNEPEVFIDVALMYASGLSLVGVTLAEWKAGKTVRHADAGDFVLDLSSAQSPAVLEFVREVASHLDLCGMRQATRNQNHQFLPAAKAGDAFGLPFVHSTLQRCLKALGKTKAKGEQWIATIKNFEKKGLRADELNRSGVVPELLALDFDGHQATADEIVEMCSFAPMRLSVIPVVNDAQRQLRFTPATTRPLKRAKKLPNAQSGQTRTVVETDPVLGYRLEKIQHQALWGTESHWQAVSHDGRVVNNVTNRNLLATAESAAALAASDAKLRFPKRLTLGRWSHLAWSGGKDYCEWLITLPYYPESYFSNHFTVRNVLAHVRCDVRDGADGERVLLIQEVQSDWAKSLRQAIDLLEVDEEHPQFPPFWREWAALTMKLVLLHAAHQGLDAVAWTRGAHQAFRYKGLGAKGLKQLYDQILPREVNRMIKPFGVVCEELGVFVPANFSIKQSEDGYEVYTAENELLGTAPTLEDARQFVPDGAHELLYAVHGVRLSGEMRQAILSTGFPAWG
ncbi:MAG: hypothetical protein PSV40_10290 [Polaromonas sp.]|uniref:hypothetical protein n=1 Tax=Polaromonas sp. TaxID=1869339 RepID=UPI0024873CBF|nr:hypothetical protein [Polaromonas sp.]MDI1269471.1 hypothetical protein [Polaromonas sp.]